MIGGSPALARAINPVTNIGVRVSTRKRCVFYVTQSMQSTGVFPAESALQRRPARLRFHARRTNAGFGR